MDEIRLIDAEKLMKELFKTSLWDNQDEDIFVDLIESQLTAYNIESVVEQLEERIRECERIVNNYHEPSVRYYLEGLVDAIEIVKGGRANE